MKKRAFILTLGLGLISLFIIPSCNGKKNDQPNKSVKLSREDQAQMIKLRKEILPKIDEMGKIIGKNLGKDIPSVGKFVITINRNGQATTTDVVVFDDELVLGTGLCYDEEGGVCCDCPCP